MPPRSIHHLGVAVTNLEEALETYSRLFDASVEHRATVPDQGVEAASLLLGTGRIELLEPLGDDTPVGRFLAKRGAGMHHVAYAVDDIDTTLERIAATGIELIDAKARVGIGGSRVAFLQPRSTGRVLTEIVEPPEGGH